MYAAEQQHMNKQQQYLRTAVVSGSLLAAACATCYSIPTRGLRAPGSNGAPFAAAESSSSCVHSLGWMYLTKPHSASLSLPQQMRQTKAERSSD